jgi:IS6 family transposase
VEALLAERGIVVDHVRVYRWVQTCTAEFIDAARPARHATGDRRWVEVTIDRAPVYPRVSDELAPAARPVLEQYANNRVEADHGRLKARLRPMRALTTIRSLRTVAAGHAFVQNLRRGHYEISTDVPVDDRVRVAFTELAPCL